MFAAIATMPMHWVIAGIIWSLAMGFAVGNYACSLVYRLPRGRLILDKKPYCGNCGGLLQVKDLFPVFSALSLKHRCRYCGAGFPISHTWTEILVGLLFMFAFFQVGFSEQYILIVTIGVFLITLAAIQANEGIIMGRIVLCTMIFGIMFRILQDHTIYEFFAGGLYAFILGAIVWRKQIKPAGHIYTLPKPLELFAVGGICVGGNLLLHFIILYVAIYAICWLIGKARGKVLPYTVAYGVAVTLTLLYPNGIVLLN